MSIGDEFEAYLSRYQEAYAAFQEEDLRHGERVAGWPQDPNGSMVPILERSVEEAKARHPSAQPVGVTLTAADRCDSCPAAALYRIQRDLNGVTRNLDWCRHHFFKHFPKASGEGWRCIGANPDLFEA